MNDIGKNSLKKALFRAIHHEINDNFEIGNIGIEMRDALLRSLIKWNVRWTYPFPNDLAHDLRMANGTQRILPLIAIYDDFLEKNEK